MPCTIWRLAVPVGYKVIRKDLYYCDIKTKKAIRKASVTKNEHFRDLVQQVCKNQIKFEYVLTDNWFGSKDNMEYIHHELGRSLSSD
jgi:hypothetical protein